MLEIFGNQGQNMEQLSVKRDSRLIFEEIENKLTEAKAQHDAFSLLGKKRAARAARVEIRKILLLIKEYCKSSLAEEKGYKNYYYEHL